jgi:hypothetical protein
MAENKTLSRNLSNGAYWTYCHLQGYRKGNGFKLKNKRNGNADTSNNENEARRISSRITVAFSTAAMENNFSSDMWIFDSGASCHYCSSIERLVEV